MNQIRLRKKPRTKRTEIKNLKNLKIVNIPSNSKKRLQNIPLRMLSKSNQ